MDRDRRLEDVVSRGFEIEGIEVSVLLKSDTVDGSLLVDEVADVNHGLVQPPHPVLTWHCVSRANQIGELTPLTTITLDTLDVCGTLLRWHADALSITTGLTCSLEVGTVDGILASRSIGVIHELGIVDQGLVSLFVEAAVR